MLPTDRAISKSRERDKPNISISESSGEGCLHTARCCTDQQQKPLSAARAVSFSTRTNGQLSTEQQLGPAAAQLSPATDSRKHLHTEEHHTSLASDLGNLRGLTQARPHPGSALAQREHRCLQSRARAGPKHPPALQPQQGNTDPADPKAPHTKALSDLKDRNSSLA